MNTSPANQDSVMKLITPEAVTSLLVDLVNIGSPTGEEKEVAQYLFNEV